MAKTREEWIEEARKNSPGGACPSLVPVAKVRNISEVLRGYFGEYQHMGLDKALGLEASGTVQIVGVFGQDLEGGLIPGGE